MFRRRVPIRARRAKVKRALQTGIVREEPDLSVLDHSRHRALYDIVRQYPSISPEGAWKRLQRLQPDSKVPQRRVRFDLSTLWAGGLLAFQIGHGGENLYFVREDADLWNDPRTRLLFRSPPAFRIAVHVLNRRHATRKTIAHALGLRSWVAWYWLGRLRRRELVTVPPGEAGAIYESTTLLRGWAKRVAWRVEDEQGNAASSPAPAKASSGRAG